jgi:IS6 family transposase
VRTKPTTSGYEAMAMIRKGQVRNIGGRDIKAQGRSIATMFEVAA